MKIIKNELNKKYKNKNFLFLQKFIYSNSLNIYIKLFIISFFIYQDLLYEIKYLNYIKIEKQENINNRNIDNKFFKDFKSLKLIRYDNASLLSEYRTKILKIFSRNTNNKINFIDNLFIDSKYRFGNLLVLLNKIIFYCEILKCKKILLRKTNSIFIKNKIKDDEFNLTIEVINSSRKIKLKNTLSFYFPYAFFNFLEIRPENRFYIIKKEILKNLPFIETKKNELYIHIRGGDIFIKAHKPYSQPPYCFYKTIINENKFNKIFIISQDKLNPIVNKLIEEFPKIIFRKNKIELDLAYLAYSYNIVGSISSFLIGIIKLNDNLINYWEYNIYRLKEKILHFHHSIYNYKRNYTIYLMNPSKNYIENMYNWRASKRQINIMLKDKCQNKFKILKP